MDCGEREEVVSVRLLMPSARNLVVRAKIGEAAIWVVLDTGAAKSFVQTQVSMDMAADQRCRKAAGKRLAIDNPLRVEGVEKGRKCWDNLPREALPPDLHRSRARPEPEDLLHRAGGGLRIGLTLRENHSWNA